jgi:predicted transcriptional regulator
MKAKNVNIGIKSVEEALNDFVITGEALERGEKVKPSKGIYFTNLDAFRKVLTQKRLELLHIIKTEQPESITHLARLAGRDITNVADDVKYLSEIGLLEMKKIKRAHIPTVNYDSIHLKIAV